MDITLRSHIEQLERRIRELGAEMMNTKDRNRLNAIEAEIRMATLALDHYRAAMRFEADLGSIP